VVQHGQIEAVMAFSPSILPPFSFKHISLIVKMRLLGLKAGALGFESKPKWRYHACALDARKRRELGGYFA
jgi:hypothetical protein